MVENGCPECGHEFDTVWQVAVGTNLQGYTPVFGGPVVVDIGRCNNCNTSFERIGDGTGHRQGAR
jgi:hypothetical protein